MGGAQFLIKLKTRCFWKSASPLSEFALKGEPFTLPLFREQIQCVTEVLVSQEECGCPDFHKYKWTAYHFKKVAKTDAEFWKKNNKKGAHNGTQFMRRCLPLNLSPRPSWQTCLQLKSSWNPKRICMSANLSLHFFFQLHYSSHWDNNVIVHFMQFNSKHKPNMHPWDANRLLILSWLNTHCWTAKLGLIITWKIPQFSTEDKVSQSHTCKVIYAYEYILHARLQKHAEKSYTFSTDIKETATFMNL